MAKILTEQEVATVGGKSTSNPTLCCTATRASALNCNVTSPSGAASNQLITGVSRKGGGGPTITDSYITYKNVSVGTSTNPDGDIPHTGGSRRAQATVTYQYATVTTYSNGTSTTGTYSNGSEIIYGAYVEASGVTETTARTYIGSSTPSGTVAGATRTGSAVSIYREAYTKPAPNSYKISLSNNTGKTSPVVNFYINSTYAGPGCGRISASNSTFNQSWTNTGTVNKVSIIENQSYIKYITIVANGTTVLSKYYIGGTISNSSISLSRTFATSNFTNGQTISISFSDS